MARANNASHCSPTISLPEVREEKTSRCNLISPSQPSRKGRGFFSARARMLFLPRERVSRPSRACPGLQVNNPTGIQLEGGTFTPLSK